MDEKTLMLLLWKKLHWNMNMLTEVMLWTGWTEQRLMYARSHTGLERGEAYVLHEQMLSWMIE